MTALLTSTQKAAVVLAQADGARALRILKSMSEAETVLLLSAMATLPAMSPAEIDGVIGEFDDLGKAQNSPGAARRLMVERLGNTRAQEVLANFLGPQKAHPLLFLNDIEPTQIATFISDEHPQTIAVVLAHLPALQAALVLKAMSEILRTDVARRIATMGRVYPEAVRHIADVLDEQLSALLRSGVTATELGGLSSIVAILNQTDRSSEKQILADLEEADPALAEEIRNELFVFDDIVSLDDRTLQLILRNVVPKELAVALKNASPELLDKFASNMSERAAADLNEEIEVLGPTRLSQVEAAQTAVVRIVRQLEVNGEIVLARSDDELV